MQGKKWNQFRIEQHKRAAQLLDAIKDEAIVHLAQHPQLSEYDLQQFIVKQFKERKLVSSSDPPIVAFRENTAFVHYYPQKLNSKKLKPNSLIMIDIWARLNEPGAPFADITWMAFYGQRVPDAVQKIFSIVVDARDLGIGIIERQLQHKKLPIAGYIDMAARKHIAKQGHGKQFRHTLGHSLGFTSPHGQLAPLKPSNKKKIFMNLGYTIEPGIYLEGKFGVRSEINFYVSDDMKLHITTPIQKEIVKIL